MLIIILIITIVVVVIVTGIAKPIFKTEKAIKLIRVGDVRTVINLMVNMLIILRDADLLIINDGKHADYTQRC